MSDVPSLFPLYDSQNCTLQDGTQYSLTSFCKDRCHADAKCLEHYRRITQSRDDYYLCPFGFTSRKFEFKRRPLVVTGIVAFPRFDSAEERKRAKDYSFCKTTRGAIDGFVKFLCQIEDLRAEAIESASKVLPHAFHELRKLNGAVLQNAEVEISDRGESRNLLSIKAAAELMRNNFDILEALSNIDGIKTLPLDSTINLFDLAFKMKRVYQEKAATKNMSIHINGNRPIILGSQKSFPIVPAVLLENAIKYGLPGTQIRADISTSGRFTQLVVENRTTEKIDCAKCFDRGVRFSDGVEGGGFGLFLAREVVLCHKGHIQCRVEGDSVRLEVELPYTEVIPHVK